MSLSGDILAALASAGEPMTTAEIIDALDLERGQKTTVAVSSALGYHVSTGKITRFGSAGARGYRYLLTPTGEQAAQAAEAAQPPTSPKAAASTRRSTTPVATARDEGTAAETVRVSRRALALVLRTAHFGVHDASHELVEALRELRTANGEVTHA